MAKPTFENEIVSGGQLAHALNVTPSMIANLAAQGRLKRVARGQYLVCESIRLYVAGLREAAAGRPAEKAQAEMTAQKTRTIALRNAKMEAELEKQVGTYVDVAEADAYVTRILRDAQQKMWALNNRLTYRASLTREQAAIIETEIRDVMVSIADGALVEVSDADIAGAAAAREAKGLAGRWTIGL